MVQLAAQVRTSEGAGIEVAPTSAGLDLASWAPPKDILLNGSHLNGSHLNGRMNGHSMVGGGRGHREGAPGVYTVSCSGDACCGCECDQRGHV